MDDLTFTTQSSFLHHGIEGQKWGVRNGPPYPLDSQNAKRIKSQYKEKVKNARENLMRNTARGTIEGAVTGVSAGLKMYGVMNRVAKIFSDNPDEPVTNLLGATLGLAISTSGSIIDGKIAGLIYSAISKNDTEKKKYSKALEELEQAKQEYKLARKYVDIATSSYAALDEKTVKELTNIKKQLKLQ